MKKPERTVDLPESDLVGLPGIGAVRRAALSAAGITTQAQLAESTVDELIKITGIQKAYAAKALEMARAAGPATEPGVPPAAISAPVGDDHPLPDMQRTIPIQEADPPATLDNAIARATTALASASQHHQEAPPLQREFIRFAKLLQRLPTLAAMATGKRQTRVADRLDRATERLDKSVSKRNKRSKASAEDLREGLRSDRDRIVDLLVTKGQRKLKDKK